MGCLLDGLTTGKKGISVSLARRLDGAAGVTIISMGYKIACPNAAFANGELFNALDHDALLAGSHITAFVLPALLAGVEKEGATGKEVILAIAVGHEVAASIAKGTSRLMEFVPKGPNDGIVKFPAFHGFSATAFGAVAGAGKILKLGEEKLYPAFATVGTITLMNSMPKWYNSPPAALIKYPMDGCLCQAGMTSVCLAHMAIYWN